MIMQPQLLATALRHVADGIDAHRYPAWLVKNITNAMRGALHLVAVWERQREACDGKEQR